ncbi:MAG TPA: hypothetical protein VIE65_03265, partial [Methylobacter sp.]
RRHRRENLKNRIVGHVQSELLSRMIGTIASFLLNASSASESADCISVFPNTGLGSICQLQIEIHAFGLKPRPPGL